MVLWILDQKTEILMVLQFQDAEHHKITYN